jgi:lysophospholipase L1-like esterase
MAYPAILGRRLDRPIINLGFSGNGKMDAEMGDLLAELDPAVYVIDCSANLFAPAIEKRTPPLVRKIRVSRPRTPIVLVEDRTFANAWLVPGKREDNLARRQALRTAYERLTAAGVGDLHYVEGRTLLGDDDEATVDASHPTDLGMLRMADALEPVLRPLAAASSTAQVGNRAFPRAVSWRPRQALHLNRGRTGSC